MSGEAVERVRKYMKDGRIEIEAERSSKFVWDEIIRNVYKFFRERN